MKLEDWGSEKVRLVVQKHVRHKSEHLEGWIGHNDEQIPLAWGPRQAPHQPHLANLTRVLVTWLLLVIAVVVVVVLVVVFPSGELKKASFHHLTLSHTHTHALSLCLNEGKYKE